MKHLKIEINYDFCQLDELNVEEADLIRRAIAATDNAYAEYSHFRVGAALRLADGTIVTGANQENAAFPSGLCAERTALFAAQANYPDQPVCQLAIAARNDNGLMADPVTPCGACRQVMLEVEERYKKPMEILLYGTKGVYRLRSVHDVLPFSFTSESTE